MKKVVSGALVIAAVTAALFTAAPVQADGAQPPATSRWLGKQLVGGLVHNDQYDFDDYGLSIDVGLALDELGRTAEVRTVRKALAANVASYTTGVDYGASDVFAGATAKAAVFARAAGADPADFGGVDLVAQLSRRIATKAPIAGRLQDKGAEDYANVIGQSYAVDALTAARSPKATKATRFLLSQQCRAGYFRLDFTADTSAGDQTCDGGKRAGDSAPDTDATALAVLALLENPKPSRAVDEAVERAVSWLERTQARNGSFGGGRSTARANANSTGLAAWALGSAGSCARATKAASWLRTLVVSGVPGEKGAVAYDRAALAGARDGISVEERDQFVRSTAQAAPALHHAVVNECD
ncbi:hypothetical protein [Nocardioides zeicaulis]|uniref:Peptidase n=1 Tax=Nocardioides zeicaulis TaxID=1776857 RepID=A0ABV6DXZ0_9ACTN